MTCPMRYNINILWLLVPLLLSSCVKDLEDEKVDAIIHKMSDIPRNLYIIPILYALIINCFGNWLSGKDWIMTECVYVIYLTVLYFISFAVIKKVLCRKRRYK